MTDADVAIVGYGPVGQSLAILLGRLGWRVVAFDRQPELYPLPRACHLDHEAMRILQAMGIADAVHEAIVPAREYLLLRADLSVLSDLPRGWRTPTGWEASYHFFQPDIEGIFDRAATSTPGVRIRQGVEVRTIESTAQEVVLTVGAPGSPGTETVRATFAIGADGANSFVRRALGIGEEDLGFEATWVVNDVEVHEGRSLPDVPDTGQVLDPAQPRHMAWLGGRHYRWEFMLSPGADPVQAAAPEAVWPTLSRWVDPSTADLLRSAAYTFRSLVADTFRSGRVMLAGDAAHLMPPFMGQGMVSGMRDAATLAWMLDLVLRGSAPVAFLDAYTRSRRPHVLAFIRQSMEVGLLVCETDPVKAAARDRVLAAQIETPPPFQPAVTAFVGDHPLAGTIAVQPRIANRDGRLLDDVLGFRFALLSPAAIDVGADVAAALRRLGAATAVIRPRGSAPSEGDLVEADRRFTDWLAASGADWVLVRPDGYVATAGAGAESLEESLASLWGEIAVAA
ncbi:bifunctional 3-(3-hydroxy-phenyl)propionate/3-hydroxycinnamic acid hydroxylase [Microbacterium ulmi]|uniref:Bifunctional 3-(3-hydroxy-phenyl)propionate/3-hydroxycinnamic acid hydroxylase n=1 Tax=Microbacterium ulmi TaxID=179095 RepID=A0A7Y2M0H6_9MICO|nr:bifunctional 3-(3-hydroxy-phenyl)propionate/3-hydroxycinnamic acid hydroxylase [Microbacterium ulmi]NII68964.1 2-polyprenyl-6-methoxyphenol hydroxylase-like FAD-dependent oxidoreductase [Microbacterium ulmi]NNH03947.1 bifunctional 3-(3-hydroxy-phenyl)propionate/3-hydroxycinnamic acid hydroxylase [Microbacterium ulmi]